MFDPYRKWLGIPPKDQPPNHYRLLGLELFEADLDVIEGAADRAMGFIRQYQSGEHAALAAKLLNEVATARLCLLKPATKSGYDAKLRTLLDSTKTSQEENDLLGIDLQQSTNDLPAIRKRPPTLKRAKSKRKDSSPLPLIAGGSLIAAIVLVLVFVSRMNQTVPQGVNATSDKTAHQDGSQSPASVEVSTTKSKPTTVPVQPTGSESVEKPANIVTTPAVSPPIPGLIPSPSPLSGNRRWQMFTKKPGSGAGSVHWSPDGRWLGIATGRIVRIYEVDKTPKFQRILVGHTDFVHPFDSARMAN